MVMLVVSAGFGRGLQAQDLSGQWTGSVSGNGPDTKQKIVLTITESDSAVAGVLHWYFPETQYIRHIIVSGRFYGRDCAIADDPGGQRDRYAERIEPAAIRRGVAWA